MLFVFDTMLSSSSSARSSARPGLIDVLKKSKGDFEMKGADKGKAVVIKASAKNAYLKWIKREILDAYEKAIKDAGGIDLHIVGVEGRGHVAFHESGIPLNLRMLLIKLDDKTK